MKIAIIIGGLLLIAFIALGIFADEGGTVSEKIERECRRSYGSQGDAAVTECQASMSIRYLRDAERERANSTYSRIR